MAPQNGPWSNKIFKKYEKEMSETLRSLCSHALLILVESYESKCQVVHQKSDSNKELVCNTEVDFLFSR